MDIQFTKPLSICSFCQNPQSQAYRMVGNANAIICDECVSACLSVYLHHNRHFFDGLIAKARRIEADRSDGHVGNIVDQLSTMFHHKRIGNSTTLVLCDTIAADARFNIWFCDHVKSRSNTTEDEMFDCLDYAEQLAKRCDTIVQAFDAGGDLEDFEASLSELTREMLNKIGGTTNQDSL